MFRGRGPAPNITINNNNNGNNGNNNNNNNNNDNNNAYYHNHYGYYYVVHYDKNFLLMEIITTLLIIAIGAIVFIWFKKIDFNDPILKEKQNFLTFQLITPLITILLAVAITFLSRTKEELIKLLRMLAIVSICIIIITIGMQVDMNKKYTEDKFNEFYEQYEKTDEKSDDKEKISVGFTGVRFTTVKEDYIQKSKESYGNFKIKSTIYIGTYILLTLFIIYLSARISHNEEKQEELSQDDKILFDEDIHYK